MTMIYQRTVMISAVILVVCAVSSHAVFAQETPSISPDIRAGLGQLDAPLEWIDVPGTTDQSYMVQRTVDGRLFLTPNECFFPRGGLTAQGNGPISVDGLNGADSFASIGQWNADDAAEWGVWLQPGELQVHVRMTGAVPGSQFSVTLGEQSESFFLSPETMPGGTPDLVASLSFQVPVQGKYSLILTDESQASASHVALHWIELSGPAAVDGAVLRKRWRPAAAHTKFSSSHEPDGVRLWIMELDAVPGDLGFYCPVTTPFGYYGPTWNADGTVNTSFNFSLWSFGRGKEAPPIEQLSHLIAIGNPEATFSGFSHEGTGVKIRNWEPLQGRQGQRQALALRVEPGDTYDTYFSYFYVAPTINGGVGIKYFDADSAIKEGAARNGRPTVNGGVGINDSFATDENCWRLFGVGKKFNNGRPFGSLWVGSFVEVPGPPPRQRSGAYEREMRYRGWVVDPNGVPQPLDRMTNGNVNKTTGLTHTDRGVTSDGWFYLSTGGWTFRKAASEPFVELPSTIDAPEVDYLDPDDLAYLSTVPCEITGTRLTRSGSSAQLTFDIRNLGENPSVLVYHGTEEGLTFADRWSKTVTVERPQEGSNTIMLTDVAETESLCVRLFLKNDEGQFWSMDTLSAE
jgi:hypothetical protein